MNSKLLEEIDASVQQSLPLTSSVLVIRHGYIVFEKYYSGNADTTRSLYWATSSVLSALIGIAIEQGLIRSVDQKMIDFFPIKARTTMDARVREISIRHLLTMSDGIRSAGNMLELFFDEDNALSVPLKSNPGLVFDYNEASPQILSMIITSTTGLTALDYGKKFLFDPIGITEIEWKELQGISAGSYGIQLRTRDMARIGYLYLREGMWQGRRILSESWINESTRQQILTGQSKEHWRGYGFYWWVSNFYSYRGYFAYGIGGQTICVIPDLDIVAVVTTSDFRDEPSWNYIDIIEKHVVSSVLAK
jgi:CubicO group peptidase (beta-lactamase class C family)